MVVLYITFLKKSITPLCSILDTNDVSSIARKHPTFAACFDEGLLLLV